MSAERGVKYLKVSVKIVTVSNVRGQVTLAVDWA